MEARTGIRIMGPQEDDVPIVIFLFLALSIAAASVVLYFLFMEFFELEPAIFIRNLIGLR